MSDVPWWAFPGNKVVFVDGDGDIHPDCIDTPAPRNGEVCTIECVENVYLGILGYADDLFGVWCFRPLVSDDNEVETRIFLKRPVTAPVKEIV